MTQGVGPRQADPRSLAASLAPVLIEACEGRLSPITWYRADWQRGGAATGTAEYVIEGDRTAKVVVKLPVVPRERMWISRLQDEEDQPGSVAPRLYASGDSLAGYDLAWMVIERVPHGPLGAHWHDDHAARMAEAAARFHAGAAQYPVDQAPRNEPWEEQVDDARQSLRDNDVPRRQEWQAAVKTLRGRLGQLVESWEARDSGQWLHGDLHLANAMSRVSLDSGPVCLIDFGEVHAGHWIEDAIYLERQLWARPQRLKAHKPVKEMAAARRKLGLPVDEDYPRLAMIRRALMAGTAPKYLKSEGGSRHLNACLDWLERALVELK
ncbi:MAG: phosphotransferase [Planctomycetota bacterium]